MLISVANKSQRSIGQQSGKKSFNKSRNKSSIRSPSQLPRRTSDASTPVLTAQLARTNSIPLPIQAFSADSPNAKSPSAQTATTHVGSVASTPIRIEIPNSPFSTAHAPVSSPAIPSPSSVNRPTSPSIQGTIQIQPSSRATVQQYASDVQQNQPTTTNTNATTITANNT